MKGDLSKHSDQELEAFFSALRDEPADASPELLARIVADAYDAQDALIASVTEPTVTRSVPAREGWLGRLLGAIGGWPAAAGLATVVMAGLWIGYNPPVVLDDLALALLDSSYDDGLSIGAAMPAYDDLLADG